MYALIISEKSRYYHSILKIVGLRTNQRGPNDISVNRTNIAKANYIVLEIPSSKDVKVRNPNISMSIDNVKILSKLQEDYCLSWDNYKGYEIPSLVDWSKIRDQSSSNAHNISDDEYHINFMTRVVAERIEQRKYKSR